MLLLPYCLLLLGRLLLLLVEVLPVLLTVIQAHCPVHDVEVDSCVHVGPRKSPLIVEFILKCALLAQEFATCPTTVEALVYVPVHVPGLRQCSHNFCLGDQPEVHICTCSHHASFVVPVLDESTVPVPETPEVFPAPLVVMTELSHHHHSCLFCQTQAVRSQ